LTHWSLLTSLENH